MSKKHIKAILERVKAAQKFKEYSDNGNTVCTKHTRLLATAVGLKSRFTTVELKKRLLAIGSSRNTIGDLLTADETYCRGASE
jgi:hypothetical protein